MCGIIGVITTDPAKGVLDKRLYMKQGLIIDTLRGKDSTGIFYQEQGEDAPLWAKQAEDGFTFVHDKLYTDYAKDTNKYWYTIGHNRAATVGGVSVDTAHPFEEGAITLVHNGTLRGTNLLPKSQWELKVDVDSHALCHNLAIVDPADAATEVLENITGAYVLVWHDSRDNSLNICRNSERPLHMAESAYSNTLYIASEMEQLILLNNSLKLGMGTILYPSPGLHLKFKEGSLVPEVAKYSTTPKYQSYIGTNYRAGMTTTPVSPTGGTGGRTGATKEETSPYPKDVSPLVFNSNMVNLGGRLRPLPWLLQESLLEQVGLVPQDRLLMTPLQIMKGVQDMPRVVGIVDRLDLPCVVYSLSRPVATNNFNQRWLVRPAGIKQVEGTKLLIAMLVTFNGDARHQVITKFENAALNTVKGPRGEYMDEKSYIEAVKDGCSYCETPIMIGDASDLTWFGPSYPLCKVCSAANRRGGGL